MSKKMNDLRKIIYLFDNSNYPSLEQLKKEIVLFEQAIKDNKFEEFKFNDKI